MKIEYRQAGIDDAELLVNIYNASFYDDYVRYGSCPGYGQTKEMMEESIRKYLKHVILCDKEPVGCVSCINLKKGVYEVGCLCVIPEYQGKGIGTQAIRYVKTFYEDWERITLVTPIDKKENVKFYTEKCGFRIESTERDGNVKLVRFVAEKNDSICIKLAETDEELCGRGYVHYTSWQEAYRGIVCDQYLDSMTVEATTARARQFPENTLIAKDKEKVVGFAVYGPSRDEDLMNAGEVTAIYVLSEYYDQKIGYRLMNEAISRLGEYNTVLVWVLEKNERAISFYHKYGFEFDGCKKEWNLGTPVSIVRMTKKQRI